MERRVWSWISLGENGFGGVQGARGEGTRECEYIMGEDMLISLDGVNVC
jgi:hypothetical protein